MLNPGVFRSAGAGLPAKRSGAIVKKPARAKESTRRRFSGRGRPKTSVR